MDRRDSRGGTLARATARGALAGLAGVAVMTVVENLEQSITARPDSFVPGRTLRSLLGVPTTDAHRGPWSNHLMHWGTGAVLGGLRGAWAAVGIRGNSASALHSAVRLAFDQTMENLAGTGAPPSTWPRKELAIDVGHKVVYAFVTGTVADRSIAPLLTSSRGRVSH